MFRAAFLFGLLCAACGPVEQPGSIETIAAYEVPLPTQADKARFLALLNQQAVASGFHVDAATEEELKVLSNASPLSFSAAVWRGENDNGPIASAMDSEDHLGRVWIVFSLGEYPDRARRFRESLVPSIMRVWPETAPLPIMPNGGIPLARDLVRTPSGYVVSPAQAHKYQE